jgi:uncharacterized protein
MTAGSGIRPTKSEGLRIFGVVPYCRITTFRRDGTAVGVPVWQAVGGDRIYIFTEAASAKVKRLRRDPRVEVTTCDMRGNLDGGPTWTGTGRVVDGAADVRKAYAALDAKYGWQKWIVDILSRLSGRYDKRAILEITLED